MSLLFISSIATHRICSIYKNEMLKCYDNDTTIPREAEIYGNIGKETLDNDYDFSNVTTYVININRYYRDKEYVGCITDDYSNNKVLDDTTTDIRGHDIVCKRTINMRYYDDEKEIASITYGYNSGEIIQFKMMDNVVKKYSLCKQIINTLKVHPDCRFVSQVKSSNIMSEYLEYRGNEKKFGPISYYKIGI